MTRGETGVMARGPREQWHVDNPPHPQSQTGSDCTSLAPKTEGPSRIGIMVYGARRNLTDVLKRFPAGGRIKAERCPSGSDCTCHRFSNRRTTEAHPACGFHVAETATPYVALGWE